MIKMIVAATKEGLIGSKKGLPWVLPEELKFFKKMTVGHTLLWGRKTFASLPKKLEDRTHYVITTAPYVENADEVLNSIEQTNKLLKKYRNSKKTLFICGGKSIYEQFYQEATEIFWTEVKVPAHGNVFLKLDLTNYQREIYEKNHNFNIYLYKKKEHNKK